MAPQDWTVVDQESLCTRSFALGIEQGMSFSPKCQDPEWKALLRVSMSIENGLAPAAFAHGASS